MTGRYQPPVPTRLPGHNISSRELMGMIASTADVTALANTMMDAYKLTVSLERDITQIKEHFAEQRQRNEFDHDEIMLAMMQGFEDRKRAVATIEKVVMALIERDQYEMAHAATMQLTAILQRSPVEDAYSKNRR